MTAVSRVLITGAGGFIGRWSVAPLLDKGYEVHAVLSDAVRSDAALADEAQSDAAQLDEAQPGAAVSDAAQSGAMRRAIPQEINGAVVHRADLLNESAMDALIERVAPTHLLHFAWIATPGVYWQSADNARWLRASQQLLRRFQALGGTRAVMAGTCAEYDWQRADVCVERSTPLATAGEAAPTPYVANKIALQDSLAKFAAETSLSTAWGRVFFQFGPHEHENRLVPSVIRHLLMNQEALCTHGLQVRSFLHVADVGAAFAQLLDSDVRGPVNIGSGERISLADLIGRIGLKIGRPDLVRLGARAPVTAEPPLLVPDVHRLRDEVRFTPHYSLNGAIEDSIAWWRGELDRQARP